MNIMTKGQMIKYLKANGVRKTPEGKKLESCKTYVIANLYFDVVERVGA
jgi:hypothetical protein